MQDGMQREIFQKFVRKLNEHCETVLIGSEIDYRRVIAQSQRSADQVSMKHFLFWQIHVKYYFYFVALVDNSFIYECCKSWLFSGHSLVVLHVFDGHASLTYQSIHNSVSCFCKL